jgi:diaminopimelate decarboxylase
MLNRLINTISGLKSPLKTPFYLFDELILEHNYSVLASLFDDTSCHSSIAYSIKTNPLDIIASKVKDCGAWAEVVSLPELQLAKRCGFKEIIFNGIHKTDEELIYAANIGSFIVLDGHRQVNSICKIAEKIKKNIKVGIRISNFPILNDNGARFGLPVNSNELEKLAKDLVEISNIELCCLHIHLGTNITDPRFYSKALKSLSVVKTFIEHAGASIRYFDIGGGMPGYIDDKWKLIFREKIKQFNDSITDHNTTLIIEPGRSIVETSGFLVTQIKEGKM